MLSSRGKIRISLFIVAFISLGASYLSLSYMTLMGKKIEEIAYKDASMAELGEKLTRKMLEARREEKNFIIEMDTLYIEKNKAIQEQIKAEVKNAREVTPAYPRELDSLDILVVRYGKQIDLLVSSYRKDPKILSGLGRQINKYEEDLKKLVEEQNLDPDALPFINSFFSIDLLAETTKLSAEKSKLFSELKEISRNFMSLTQKITADARESLVRHSEEGMSFSVKAQRNTLTLLILASLILAYMIFYLPHKILLPFKKIIRSLNAIARGEIGAPLPDVSTGDELGELSRSFQQAIQKLKYFNELKTSKIIEIERNFRRSIDEVDESVIILFHDLKISYLNSAARKMFLINSDVISKSMKDLPVLWEIFGDSLESIEKKGRVEYSVKLKKRDFKKRTVTIIPNKGKGGKLENILVIIK